MNINTVQPQFGKLSYSVEFDKDTTDFIKTSPTLKKIEKNLDDMGYDIFISRDGLTSASVLAGETHYFSQEGRTKFQDWLTQLLLPKKVKQAKKKIIKHFEESRVAGIEF